MKATMHTHLTSAAIFLLRLVFLAGYALSAQAQEEFADASNKEKLAEFYTVEVIVFTNDGIGGETEESWSNNLVLTYPESVAVLSDKSPDDIYPELIPGRVARPNTSGISFLPLLDKTHLTLSDTANRLAQSPEHHVLLHKVWLQRLDFENAGTAVSIQGGERKGDIFEIGGTLKIFKTDYINLETHLWRVQFDTLSSNTITQWPVPPVIVINNYDAKIQTRNLTLPTDSTIKRISKLDNKRGIRSGKLYYIDHPLLGVLIEVRPYHKTSPQ